MLSSTDAEKALRVAYQTEMGIYNHYQENPHPLAMVSMHPKENWVEGGPLRSIQRKYVLYRVWDVWHLSIKEFLETPYPDAMFYLKYCESHNLNQDGLITRTTADLTAAALKK